jgi:hypothetical protein
VYEQSCKPNTRTERREHVERVQPRSKAYVTASDSEGVAADVAKYGGVRLCAAALTSSAVDMSNDDSEEGDADSGEDIHHKQSEEEAAEDEAGSDGAEASKDEDEDLEQAQDPSAIRVVAQKKMKKERRSALILTTSPKSSRLAPFRSQMERDHSARSTKSRSCNPRPRLPPLARQPSTSSLLLCRSRCPRSSSA